MGLLTTQSHKDGCTRMKTGGQPDNESYYLRLLGVTFGPLGKLQYFLICSLAILFFHVIFGIAQESLFNIPVMNSHNLFLTFLLFLSNSLLSLIQMLVENDMRLPPVKCHGSSLVTYGMLLAGTIGFSNLSLSYLNYTAQVVFKCCKPIPVLMGSFILQGKQLTFQRVFPCLLITTGVVWFSVADASVSPVFKPLGVFIVSVALVFDTVAPNYHEKTIRENGCSIVETLLYPYAVGAAFLFLVNCLVDDISVIVVGLFENWSTVLWWCSVNSVFNFIGIYFIVLIIRDFGALEASLVTNFRKMVTVIVSFIYFEKTFTAHHAYSGVLVSLGVFLESVNLGGRQSNLVHISTKALEFIGYSRLPHTKQEESAV